jgi:integrase
MWARWRKAAGWPEEVTFHSLRHHFATALITSGAEPTGVQRALRHSSLRIRLETYVLVTDEGSPQQHHQHSTHDATAKRQRLRERE